MTSLDLRLQDKLEYFWCYSNTKLIDIDIKNGNNGAIVDSNSQDFRYNTKNPKIHVDSGFLSIANTQWSNKGTCTYVNP